MANLRAAYAECKSAALTAPSGVTGYYQTITLKQTNTDTWTIDASDVGGIDLSSKKPSECVTVNVSKDGTTTFDKDATSGYTNVTTVNASTD